MNRLFLTTNIENVQNAAENRLASSFVVLMKKQSLPAVAVRNWPRRHEFWQQLHEIQTTNAGHRNVIQQSINGID